MSLRTKMSASTVILVSVIVVFVFYLFGLHLTNVCEPETQKSELPPILQQIHNSEVPPYLQPLASRTLGPPGSSPADEELERLWNFVYYRQYNCKKSEYLGGTHFKGDGAYDLCTEKKFWPKGYSKDYKCLVYSFGIGADFTFDDEMAKKGCEVHSFDPSIGLGDLTVRQTGVTFHKTGISDKDLNRGVNGWKMRTLSTLLKELGHSSRYLDYLKVDTDKEDESGFEDLVLHELLDTGLYKCVRQFSMEMHMPGILFKEKWLKRYRDMYGLLDTLSQNGWRLYNTTDNVRGAQHTIDPKYSQRRSKKEQLEGKATHILWEVSFVNFNVENECGKYL